MATVHLLGTGAGFSGPERTTTMLAFESDGRSVVVDCGGDVVQRLLVSGVDLGGIEAMIVTHEHPDHVSGFALFIEKIWLSGRRDPLPVIGIRPAIDQARRVWEAFRTESWDVPEIQWREVAHEAGAEVLVNERWRITCAPGVHGAPVVGLRVKDVRGGGVCAYSCDTAMCEPITEMSRGAGLLVHEATGTELGGHTTREQAAQVAVQAGAGRLVLVHLPPAMTDELLDEARAIFPATEFGVDGARYDF
ncbi:MBL fold metallo-hydrolase [Longimicrobium terrae]|uniref:Ribonuclease Z n=1 Tax=Longimicrobium terrae TaxID=1639882 RepID=A0A841GJT8_9BACT|nr:MBL fold metallo-hydrolase [Longimicrobium terrae]MBB4634139.1 ribonuclease Z [Longimicrobium terrae]MBB6068971.1 ribonuclease Z [Longimicrobium terrae]NNC28150.1 MBL fold metallo-hydrolase [Longimicrobium terrae]